MHGDAPCFAVHAPATLAWLCCVVLRSEWWLGCATPASVVSHHPHVPCVVVVLTPTKTGTSQGVACGTVPHAGNFGCRRRGTHRHSGSWAPSCLLASARPRIPVTWRCHFVVEPAYVVRPLRGLIGASPCGWCLECGLECGLSLLLCGCVVWVWWVQMSLTTTGCSHHAVTHSESSDLVHVLATRFGHGSAWWSALQVGG